jgi:16S rRNA (guanine1207-N2)-methyltransferase
LVAATNKKMKKRESKLLKKIKVNKKTLFLGKPDNEAIQFLAKNTKLTVALHKLNEKNLLQKKIKNKNIKTLFIKSFTEIKEKFDSSIIFHEDFLGKEGTNELLETAGKKTKLKGKIYFIGKTSRGAKNFTQKMKELFGNAKTVAVKGGLRLISSIKEKETKQQKKEKEFIEFAFKNKKYLFESSFGVFSRKKIDEGTKLLLENLKEIKENKILDFGCGIGVIGIITAKENPEKKIYLADSNGKAIKLTEKNIKLNKTNNTKVIASDGFSAIKEKFNLILSNPPTHEKRVFLEEFIKKAKKQLETKGRMIIVLNKKIFIEKKIQEVFGNYKILAQRKKHKLIQATKLK